MGFIELTCEGEPIYISIDLPTIDYDLEKEIPFDKFEELKNLYTNTIDTYGFKRPDGSVINWIE